MGSRSDVEDDDFSELYKEYTGPPGSTTANKQEKEKLGKKSLAGSDEEEGHRDPNAVPTDFTSREAKVWEAKSKATERIWKKKKEEEMICKICGESGHFTQGCPSTLGANRKSQDFFERIPARVPHVRALFSEKVIQRIEKDVGCKIKVDEKFIIVSGKDRLVLKKGVDAVHKVKDEGDQKGPSSSYRSRSRSPIRSSGGARLRRPEPPQRFHSGSHNASQFSHRYLRQEKVIEESVREDLQKISRDSPQAYGNGARARASHSRSPARPPPYVSNSYSSYDGQKQGLGVCRTDSWDISSRGSDIQSGHQFDYASFSQTLEEHEVVFGKEELELREIRDKEEDDENRKHRETLREMRENYMKKLAVLRGAHAKQWEDFLHLDIQRYQQHALHQMPAPGFGAFKRQAYSDYDGSSVNPPYAGGSFSMNSTGGYPSPLENYPSRAQGSYGEFQHQRHEGYGSAYNRC